MRLLLRDAMNRAEPSHQRLACHAEHGYGVPAFNINNLEQIQAIMQAAVETDSPVILV